MYFEGRVHSLSAAMNSLEWPFLYGVCYILNIRGKIIPYTQAGRRIFSVSGQDLIFQRIIVLEKGVGKWHGLSHYS